MSSTLALRFDLMLKRWLRREEIIVALHWRRRGWDLMGRDPLDSSQQRELEKSGMRASAPHLRSLPLAIPGMAMERKRQDLASGLEASVEVARSMSKEEEEAERATGKASARVYSMWVLGLRRTRARAMMAAAMRSPRLTRLLTTMPYFRSLPRHHYGGGDDAGSSNSGQQRRPNTPAPPNRPRR